MVKDKVGAIPVNPDRKTRLMSDADLEKVHQATMKILLETGVKFPSEKALNVFADAGADVDFKEQIVKIPEKILMDAIGNAKRPVVMASRGSEDLDMIMDGKHIYYGTDGCGTQVFDLYTREKRSSVKNDVAMTAKIADYLHSIAFYWPIVSAQDKHAPVMPLHEIEAAFINTEKHVTIITCVDPDSAKYAVKMAEVVAGSKEQMRERPPLSMLACPITPLCQDGESLDAALIFAEAGLPVGFATMPTLGATVPATIPAMLAIGNAEVLSALAYIQLVHPGAPVFYPFYSIMLNPYTGGCASCFPNQQVMNAAVTEVGQYYKLPVIAGWGAASSHSMETWQAGKEAAMDAYYVTSTCPEMINSIGSLLEEVTLLTPEALVYETEIFNSLKAMMKGFEVSDEDLAFDEINEVGPGGHYLGRRSTMQKVRELNVQGITNQWDPLKSDFKNVTEAAVEKTKWIVENHEPKPLSDDQKRSLKDLLNKAEAELLK
ncbi:MAG: trimethylamine methyltransferase family protein [Desulfobacterales bacterium]|nr:trimethylamine methyltransferase family protein [Desulfobacterales bacterium]